MAGVVAPNAAAFVLVIGVPGTFVVTQREPSRASIGVRAAKVSITPCSP
jgi:hypothetical protein